MSSNESTVLPQNQSLGPLGLGDPNDRTLRKVEKEIMIPKLIREVTKKEKCSQFVKEFEECCKRSSLLMVIKCRIENKRLKECLTKWYNNTDFKNECTQIYLNNRSEYRKSGKQEKLKRM